MMRHVEYGLKPRAFTAVGKLFIYSSPDDDLDGSAGWPLPPASISAPSTGGLGFTGLFGLGGKSFARTFPVVWEGEEARHITCRIAHPD
jgi:hypothetical protein